MPRKQRNSADGGRRSVRTPDISELRAFCAAVDLGTLGRAAVSLQISQPGLSKRLRTLEAAPGEKAPIRLAVSHTIAEFYLPPELVAYQADGERRPPVELTIANSSAIRRMVAEGQVATGITAVGPGGQPGDELEELDLLDDEVIVAVPPDHAWHPREEIPQRSFLTTP